MHALSRFLLVSALGIISTGVLMAAEPARTLPPADAPLREGRMNRDLYRDDTEFAANLASGLVMRVTDTNGAMGLVGIRGDVGLVAKGVTIYADGREETRYLNDIKLIQSEIQFALNSREIKEVYFAMGVIDSASNRNGFPDRVTLTGGEIRVRPGDDAPITYELNFYKAGLHGSLAGQVMQDRALTAGVQVGYSFFSGMTSGPQKEPWQGIGVLSGVVSGIYAFNPSAKLKGMVEFVPLIGGASTSPISANGVVVNSNATFELRVAKHISAFLRNQFQLTAIPVPSDRRQVPVRVLETFTGGAQVDW